MPYEPIVVKLLSVEHRANEDYPFWIQFNRDPGFHVYIPPKYPEPASSIVSDVYLEWCAANCSRGYHCEYNPTSKFETDEQVDIYVSNAFYYQFMGRIDAIRFVLTHE